MLALRRVTQQRAAARYWRRVGYDVLWHKSVAARRKRTIEGRLALFQELAPDAYMRMGRDAVVKWILEQTWPDRRWPAGRVVVPMRTLAGRILRTYPR